MVWLTAPAVVTAGFCAATLGSGPSGTRHRFSHVIVRGRGGSFEGGGVVSHIRNSGDQSTLLLRGDRPFVLVLCSLFFSVKPSHTQHTLGSRGQNLRPNVPR
jgi:hypothetical protein